MGENTGWRENVGENTGWREKVGENPEIANRQNLESKREKAQDRDRERKRKPGMET